MIYLSQKECYVTKFLVKVLITKYRIFLHSYYFTFKMKNFYKNFTNKIESNDGTNSSLKKKVLKRVGQAVVSLVSIALAVEAAKAIDTAIDTTQATKDVIGSEGGKEALNAALKVARSKPALSTATGIVCLACIPVAGVAASLGLCIACGILIAKTLG
jgi:hypothetical protein